MSARFTRMCCNIVNRVEPGAWTISRDMQLTHKNGALINLQNAQILYKTSSFWSRKKILTQFLEALGTQSAIQEEPFESYLDAIRPCVRNAFLLDTLRAHVEEADFVYRKLSDSLIEILMVDREKTMQSLSKKTLEQAGIPPKEAFKMAHLNLERATQGSWNQLAEGLFQSNCGDDYDSSRVLLEDYMDQVPVTGQRVVFIPDRNTLIVADSAIPNALERAFEIVDSLQLVGPITMIPFVFEGGVRPWDPNPGLRLRYLRRVYSEMVALYSDQQDLHQLEESDTHYASYDVMENEGGEMCAFTALTKGMSAHLPRADVVVLIDPNHSKETSALATVTWASFSAVMSHQLKKTSSYPPRYEAHRFPSHPEIKRMQPFQSQEGKKT
ncbi:MAG: DUF1444 family protein [Acidobacteria bacterium]|nr:DUF1444 family protein [Acidobacteriota bacterium]